MPKLPSSRVALSFESSLLSTFLKDSSFAALPLRTKDGDFTVNWELDYGAKNSLGGLVREKATFTTVGTSIFIDGSSYRLDELK